MDVDDRLVRKVLESMVEKLVPAAREALSEVLGSVPDPEDEALLLEDRAHWVSAYGHASRILRKVAILLARQEEGLISPEQTVEAIKVVLQDPASDPPPGT